MPGVELKNDGVTTQWVDIGFQDDNPTTDFRGAGYLALFN